ncbi:MAG: type IV pilus biogenesis protein PilM [Actinomycetota bacterium]
MTGAKKQKSLRPRIACEITLDRVIAARASDRLPRIEMFTSRQLPAGTVAPGLGGPNVLNGEALRTAIKGALGAVSGNLRDVIVIVPDAAIRVLLLDFEALPGKPAEIEAVIRFRLKKSLPFDVDQAAVSYELKRGADGVRVVAAVSPRSIIEEYESAIRDSGYAPGVVLPSSLAALGTVEGERPTLLLKVAPTNTMIAAAEHQELRLVRTLENPNGTSVSAEELAEGVLPSIVFFEDTFAAHVEQIYIGGVDRMDQVGPLLHEHTGARVQELAPDISPEQNLSGEHISPSLMAGIAGALLG